MKTTNRILATVLAMLMALGLFAAGASAEGEPKTVESIAAAIEQFYEENRYFEGTAALLEAFGEDSDAFLAGFDFDFEEAIKAELNAYFGEILDDYDESDLDATLAAAQAGTLALPGGGTLDTTGFANELGGIIAAIENAVLDAFDGYIDEALPAVNEDLTAFMDAMKALEQAFVALMEGQDTQDPEVQAALMPLIEKIEEYNIALAEGTLNPAKALEIIAGIEKAIVDVEEALANLNGGDDGDDGDDPVAAWATEKAKYDVLLKKIDGIDTKKWRAESKAALAAVKTALTAGYAGINAATGADALKTLVAAQEAALNKVLDALTWLDNIPVWMGWMKITEWSDFWQGLWYYVCFGWVLGLFV